LWAVPLRAPSHVLGVFPLYIGLSLVWESWLALAVSGLIFCVFVWRTAMEDRMLHRELSGYEEYAARTRFRLLPGIW
jgi:protein-S-isoprenylcysteine O-methyltransferase Ste14